MIAKKKKIHPFYKAALHVYKTKPEEFDFPDYAGLPKSIYSKLNSDHVDLIQAHLSDIHSSPTYKDWMDKLIGYAGRHYITS